MTTNENPWMEGSTVAEPTNVGCDTACLALMDATRQQDVWEDFLYDGHDHDHAVGGLMLLHGAVGTHVSWGGYFPITVVSDPDGNTVGFELELDPYGEEVPHYGFEAHGEEATGWTQETVIPMPTADAVFGDPIAVAEPEAQVSLLPLRWPSDGGAVAVSIYSEDGIRQRLRARWMAPGSF